MPKDIAGYIYIFTNPAFPQYVKIGYADDPDERLENFNSKECVPLAFQKYATYGVESRLNDLKLHALIDKLNPNLRVVGVSHNGKPRKREFYAMSPEDAFEILEAIADINNRSEYLELCEKSTNEIEDDIIAEEIEEEHLERLDPFSFDKCHIPVGSEVEFYAAGNANSGSTAQVIDNKNVEYNGASYSLSGLAKHLLGCRYSVAGPRFFRYQGRWLNDIRAEIEGRNYPARSRNITPDSWIIPCNPMIYDVKAAFKELPVLEWRQSTYIQPDDIVYIYVGGKENGIHYKCKALKTEQYGNRDIDDSRFYKNGETHELGRFMTLLLLEEYPADKFPLKKLREHGLTFIRGPIRLTIELETFLNG